MSLVSTGPALKQDPQSKALVALNSADSAYENYIDCVNTCYMSGSDSACFAQCQDQAYLDLQGVLSLFKSDKYYSYES